MSGGFQHIVRIRRLLAAGLLASLFAFGGCGEQFQPAWQVEGYRLIAIQAAPPVLQEDQTATLSVVDHIPEGTTAEYTWSWCPIETSAQNRYRCPDFELEGIPGSMNTDDPYSLGTGEQVQFEYPGTEQEVLAFCQALQRAIARAGRDSPISGQLPTQDCTRGYDISIRLAAQADGEDVIARKKLELSTGSDQINQNPVVDGIEIRPAKRSDISELRERFDWVVSSEQPRSDQWVEMPPDSRLPLAVGYEFDLRAVVDANDIETWRPPAPEGSGRDSLPPRLEIWTFEWLTTHGDLRDANRLYDPELNTLETATASGLTIHADQIDDCSTDPCRGHLWQVLRDGRLGLDWVERTYTVTR